MTITAGGLLLAAHERAPWPSRHELVGFRTHQTFIRGRSIILSRAEFEIDGKGITFNLLCPFPTDSSPPSLLKTLNPPKPGLDFWRSWPANMGVGASNLLNQGKRSGDLVLNLAKHRKKSSPPNTSLAATDAAQISSSLTQSGQE